MIRIASMLCLVAMSTIAFTPAPALADSTDIATKLQAMIAKLTPEQQLGLLQLLSGISADTAQPETPQTAKEALMEALDQFGTVGSDGEADLEPFYARISEDFEHWAVGGKSGAVTWFNSLSSSLFRDGKPLIKFDLADAEVVEDGDTATAYPVDVDTPLGFVTLEITAQREADGVWRMVGIDGL